MPRAPRSTAAVLVSMIVLAGCGTRADMEAPEVAALLSSGSEGRLAFTVAQPGRFDGRTHQADLIVIGRSSLPQGILTKARERKTVSGTASITLFTVAVEGQTLTVGSGSPDDLRAFSTDALASDTQIWRRLAAGAVIGTKRLGDQGLIALDPSGQLPSAEVATSADLDIPTDVVVNESWAAALRAPLGNALLVDLAEGTSSTELTAELERRARGRWQVVPLTGPQPQRPALLTGGAVADAVGSFLYRPHEDGTITIDPAWVSRNITSAEVPILGRVTGHRVMLPQLYGAMRELADDGLDHLVRPEQYGGIFVPRFIGRDPSRPLSLHSWGIAIDLNVATNQLGTPGDMDPRVVSVMASWGFAWGGTWSNPDPMHFELAALRSH